jgi:hypothetical protein
VAYCTVAEATEAGATGDVAAAIADAQQIIDRHTGDTFEPTTLTVAAVVGSNGVAVLPRRVRSVSSVTYVGASSPLTTTAYRVRSSATPGDIDAVELATYGHNDLIVGAESYSGGWANLNREGRRVSVTGSFGWDAPPAAVRRATALLAAHLTAPVPEPGSVPEPGVTSRTVGDASISYDQHASQVTTTGSSAVDRLLRPYRRNLAQIG